MIYLTLIFSPIIIVIKRFGRLSLVSVLMILSGCDGASSTADNSANQTAPFDSAEHTDLQNAAKLPKDSDSSHADSDNEMTGMDDSQSALAAAKIGDKAYTRRAPMIAGARDDSTLQATLMGDYGGMLPCSSCDNIDITLNLFADGSVLKTSIYNNPDSPQVPLVEPGIYRQDGNTITIVYEKNNIESYRIQDNHLVMMDQNKNLNVDYTLSRK